MALHKSTIYDRIWHSPFFLHILDILWSMNGLLQFILCIVINYLILWFYLSQINNTRLFSMFDLRSWCLRLWLWLKESKNPPFTTNNYAFFLKFNLLHNVRHLPLLFFFFAPKFPRLGNEKYKSKVEMHTLTPKWLEQFDFHLFEDQSQLLELTVWDKDVRSKDDFMGR